MLEKKVVYLMQDVWVGVFITIICRCKIFQLFWHIGNVQNFNSSWTLFHIVNCFVVQFKQHKQTFLMLWLHDLCVVIKWKWSQDTNLIVMPSYNQHTNKTLSRKYVMPCAISIFCSMEPTLSPKMVVGAWLTCVKRMWACIGPCASIRSNGVLSDYGCLCWLELNWWFSHFRNRDTWRCQPCT